MTLVRGVLTALLILATIVLLFLALSHTPKGDSRPFCECVTPAGAWVPYRATACVPHPPECQR